MDHSGHCLIETATAQPISPAKLCPGQAGPIGQGMAQPRFLYCFRNNFIFLFYFILSFFYSFDFILYKASLINIRIKDLNRCCP